MYFPPYIDGSGVHIPTYEDRLSALLTSYRAIFGPEANLEISSPDYQLLSLFARALDDLSQIVLVDFASRNPLYASGVGLDLLLPLLGLSRGGATYSTVPLRLTGTPLAVLPAAPEALDDAGYRWACQTAGIQLDESGQSLVLAVCATPGAISAPAGSVRHLVSPVPGLSAVVNPSAATPGTEAETDASCRARLRQAATAPALTPLEAIRDAVASVPGVLACAVYENDTEETDAKGIPPHAICVVIAGGAAGAVAQAIFAKKAPGIGTHGTLSTQIQDAFGVSHTVRLQRASNAYFSLTIELRMLPGYDPSTPDKIRAALVTWCASLGIGQDLVLSTLYPILYAAAPGAADASSASPPFSVSLLTATWAGQSTATILTAQWNQRFALRAEQVQILEVAG